MKPLLVLYLNIDGSTSKLVKEFSKNFSRKISIHYDCIIFPVRKQKTKVEIFYEKELEKIKGKDLAKKLEELINHINEFQTSRIKESSD